MKYFIRTIIAIFLVAFLTGCNNRSQFNKPVKFYYPNVTISYANENGFIGSELHEGKGKPEDVCLIEFLRGPSDLSFSNPFPEGTELLRYEVIETTAYLMLSDDYAALSGLDLSIANACLAMTVMELSGTDSVSISCKSEQLDGQQAIILNRNSVLLFDGSQSTVATESPSASTSK